MHMNDIVSDTRAAPGARPAAAPRTRQPAIDIIETASSYIVLADLPGVAPDAIDIELCDSVLSVSGRRTPADAGNRPRRQERVSADFARRIPLPAAIDADAIEARSDHGTLRITVPKQAGVRRRQVAIEAA